MLKEKTPMVELRYIYISRNNKIELLLLSLGRRFYHQDITPSFIDSITTFQFKVRYIHLL